MKNLNEIMASEKETIVVHGPLYKPNSSNINKNVFCINFEAFQRVMYMIEFRKDRVEQRILQVNERRNLIPQNLIMKALKVLMESETPLEDNGQSILSEEDFAKERAVVKAYLKRVSTIVFLNPDSYTLDRENKGNIISSQKNIVNLLPDYTEANISVINEDAYTGTGLVEQDGIEISERKSMKIIQNKVSSVISVIDENLKEGKTGIVILNNNHEILKLKENYKNNQDVFVAYEIGATTKNELIDSIITGNKKYKVIICNDFILNAAFHHVADFVITSTTGIIRTFCDRVLMGRDLYLIDVSEINNEDAILTRPWFFNNEMPYKLQCLVTNTEVDINKSKTLRMYDDTNYEGSNLSEQDKILEDIKELDFDNKEIEKINIIKTITKCYGYPSSEEISDPEEISTLYKNYYEDLAEAYDNFEALLNTPPVI